MYNQLLKTYITVIEKASFTKAASALYLSVPAVMKQMNQLENELGLKLLNRTHLGVTPTLEGKIIYNKSKEIINDCDSLLKNLKHQTDYHIRIASTLLYPATDFIKKYQDFFNTHPQFKIDIIYLDENKTNDLLSEINSQYDIVITLMDRKIWLNDFHFYKLEDKKIQMIFSPHHPLVKKDILSIYDLNSKKMVLAKKGSSISCDLIRDLIIKNALNVEIIDLTYYYNSNLFNECLTNHILYPAIDLWKEVNPLLQIKDIDWDIHIPYGLFYSKNASHEVHLFIESLKKYQNENKEYL